MDFQDIINDIRDENSDIERAVNAHNLGDAAALNMLTSDVIEAVQEAIREDLGAVITLYHGCETELSSDMVWNENSSFTDRFDVEFAGEDGYIVEAQVPVERIKFFLNEEREFVISAGALECTVYTVAEYFGL